MKIIKTIVVLLAIISIVLLITDEKYYIDDVKGLFITILIVSLTTAIVSIFRKRVSES